MGGPTGFLRILVRDDQGLYVCRAIPHGNDRVFIPFFHLNINIYLSDTLEIVVWSDIER